MSHDAKGGAALRLAGALLWFWHFCGNYNEARDWLERALAVSPKGIVAARAKALCEKSLALCREAGGQWGAAFSISLLAVVAHWKGEYERAKAVL